MARFDVARLLALGRVGSMAASPDGQWLAVELATAADDGTFHTRLVRVPTDGRASAPLTFADARAPAFLDDGTLLFLSKRATESDASETRSQVFALPAQGEARPLTDAPLGVMAFAARGTLEAGVLVTREPVLLGVATKKQRARADERAATGPSVLRYTRAPVRYWDHWLPEAAPHYVRRTLAGDVGRPKDLTPEAEQEYRLHESFDLDPAGKRLACIGARPAPGPDRLAETHIELRDLRSGKLRACLGYGSRRAHTEVRFTPAGDGLVAVREQRARRAHPRAHLVHLDLAGGETRLGARWDRRGLPECFLADAVVVSADDEGATRLFAVPLSGKGLVTRLSAGAGSLDRVVALPDGALAGVYSDLRTPPRPFRLTPGETPAPPELLHDLSGLSPADAKALRALDTRSIQVPGAGGTPVQCWLTSVPQKRPQRGLFWIHGGPVSAWNDVWHWRWNAAVAAHAGYVVAMPNPRGSTGFGEAFIGGVWGNTWGGDCAEDLHAVADAMEARSEVDADRIAAMGGSFGGYMSNWLGGTTKRFRALVTHASLYDLRAFSGTTDVAAYFQLQNASTAWKGDVDRYSPHARLARWKTPTLVLHGDLDYRVPITEALALFDALQLHGVESELVVFPDENHWIQKPRNIAAWYEAVFDFLDRQLAG
ncbi:MAG: prolyl oligopeptidase family serine peptidase [Myxococcota bacterium]